VGGTSNATKFTNFWDDGSINDIFALHTATCAFCHGSTRDNTSNPGTVNPTYGSVQAVIQDGTTVGCLDCHFDRSVGHGNVDHKTYDGGAGPGVVTGAGTTCVVCHIGADADTFYIDTLHNISLQGCATCHANGTTTTGAGPLVDRTAGGVYANANKDYETLNENGGSCESCHNTYPSVHFNASDHDGQLANQTECNDCHTEATGTAIQVKHGGCSVCHDTTGGYIMKAGTSAANHDYITTPSCTTCHDNHLTDFDGTTDGHFGTQPENLVSTNTHASNINGVSNCTTNCHNLGAIYDVVHTSCTTCHTSATDGSLANRTTGDATQHDAVIDGAARTVSTCLTCHSKADPYDYNVDFSAHTADTHGNMVSNTTPKCDSCHGTGVDVKVVIHNDDCQNCHINITDNGSFQDGTELDSALAGTVAGSATGHVVGTTNTGCLGCHSGYDADFTGHDAATRDSRHLTYLAGSTKCTGCHSGANIVADVHYATSATDLDCENCHIDTQIAGGTDGRFSDGTGVNSVGGAVGIYGTATGHSVGGTPSTCINCHAAYDTDFEGSHSTGGSHTNLTTSGAAQCTDCHGTGDVITSIHAGGVGCEHCHTDMTPAGGEDGTLKGSALNYTGGSTTCVDCHTVIAADFDHASHLTNDTHDAMLANYNSATRSEDCDNCHTAANGTAVRDTIHNGSIATAQGSNCEVCHVNLTTDGRLRNNANDGTTKGEASNHTIGVQSTCVICHGLTFFAAHDYGNTHTGISYDGGTNDTSYDPPQGCADCHGVGGASPYSLGSWADIWYEHNVAGETLTNGCVRCHDYDQTNGVDNTTDAAATLAAINDGAGTTETCATCHDFQTPNVVHTGSGQADDVLTINKTDWINDGDGATTGTLTVWADSTQNNGVCTYSIDYNGETTGTMSWSPTNFRYQYTFTSTTFNGTAGNVSITSGGSPCDPGKTATANDISDTITDILGPGPGGGAYYDPVDGGTLTVWATHSYPDGSLNYNVTYNGEHLMNWVGANSRYEFSGTGIGAYNANVTVHSSEPGGDLLTEPVEQAVVDDVVSNVAGIWLNDGDGAATGTLSVTFDTDDAGNSNNCTYSVTYNGGNDPSATWVTDHFEASITSVGFLGSIASISITGSSPCDDSATNTSANVDNSDVYTVTSAGWSNDVLNVVATESGNNPQTACQTATYATYNITDYLMAWTGTQFELVNADVSADGGYNGTAAKNDGTVVVHCASPGGDSVTYNSVTDDSPVSGNQLPTHTTHESSGYVKWGSNPYTVAGEGCDNCHGPDDGTLDTVMDVHNGKCNLCHVSAAPGYSGNPITLMWKTGIEGSDTAYPDYPNGRKDINLDADFTNDTIGPGTCTSCHYAFMSDKETSPGVWEDLRYKTWNHHLSENSQAGNCVHCHGTVRTVAAGSSWCVVQGSRVPKQPPCAYCHVDGEKAYGVTGNGDWQLQFFDFTADGFNTPLTKMTSTTHSIPNVEGGTGSPIVIHDFAVCFECHDKSTEYGAQNSEGDMMETHLDGNSVSVLGPAALPNKVFPYHASGMSLHLAGAANQETDPGPGNWFPIDRTTGYGRTAEAAADDVANGGTNIGDGTAPVYDNQPASWGPGQSDDFFFAYHYHPGRGGIVGTTNTISSSSPNYGGDITTQVGSFNILFPIFTPNLSNTPKYYQDGDAEDGTAPKNVYQDRSTKIDPNYTSENFGTGGSSTPTATCNPSYTDEHGKSWNFCNVVNVPYTNYKTQPNPATDLYWSRVPYFDSSTVPFPTINDEVRLLNVDCSVPVVEAWSKQSTDYYANGSEIIPDLGDGVHQAPSTGDLYLQVNGGANENMTWDGTKWSVTPSSCTTGDTITVTSTIGGGTGSASFDVP
jgi:hypothetical protein